MKKISILIFVFLLSISLQGVASKIMYCPVFNDLKKSPDSPPSGWTAPGDYQRCLTEGAFDYATWESSGGKLTCYYYSSNCSPYLVLYTSGIAQPIPNDNLWDSNHCPGPDVKKCGFSKK